MVIVLGHRGMLGRRVMERFPDAVTFDERFVSTEWDPLLMAVERARPDWVINCIGSTFEPDMEITNGILPHMLAGIAPLIQPSTDHIDDDTPYARSKREGEVGHVIRCAIVDPAGGMLARARAGDTEGETLREWNGITAKRWADVAADVIAGRLSGLIVPGSPTISHYDLLETARRIYGWKTRTIPNASRAWQAETPTLMLEPIEDQLLS